MSKISAPFCREHLEKNSEPKLFFYFFNSMFYKLELNNVA